MVAVELSEDETVKRAGLEKEEEKEERSNKNGQKKKNNGQRQRNVGSRFRRNVTNFAA